MLALYWDIKTLWVVSIFLSVLLIYLERRLRKKEERQDRYNQIKDRVL